MNIKSIIAAFLFAMLAIPAMATAATFSAEEVFSLDSDTVLEDNLYLASENISIKGEVDGDIYAVSGTTLISERVAGDVVIASGDIVILGVVEGDVRVLGGNVLLGGTVEGDVLVAGGAVRITPDALIGKDLYVAAGEVSFDGYVAGNIEIKAGSASINGIIDGDLHVKANDRIGLGNSTFVGGDFKYMATDASILAMSSGAQIIGDTSFKALRMPVYAHENKNTFLFIFGGIILLKLLSILTAAIVAVVFIPRLSLAIAGEGVVRPGRSFITGLLVCIATPIIIILLFGTLIGGVVGVIAMFSFLLFLAMSAVYSGIIFGTWLHKVTQKKKKKKMEVNWKTALTGVILLTLISFIPFIGWAIALAVYFIAMGSIARLAYNGLGKE